jgi:hypothetical protein
LAVAAGRPDKGRWPDDAARRADEARGPVDEAGWPPAAAGSAPRLTLAGVVWNASTPARPATVARMTIGALFIAAS